MLAILMASIVQDAPRPPVPDVVLTMAEAQALPPAELERRVLALQDHAAIRRVTVQQTAGVSGQVLQTIIFEEVPRPAEGRFCAARSIVATFDTRDGKLEAGPIDPARLATTPRRLFATTAYPRLAVVPGRATVQSCAAAGRLTQLPFRNAAAAQRVVGDVMALAESARGGRRAPVPIRCVDERQANAKPCDGTAALAGLDWTTLLTVDPPSSVRGPTTQLTFAGREFWWLEVTGDARIEGITLRHGYPPPF